MVRLWIALAALLAVCGTVKSEIVDRRTELRLAHDVARESNEVLGLLDSKAVRLMLPERVERVSRHTIRMADGETLEVELEPHSVRGDRFEVRLMRGDTAYELYAVAPPTTVRGRVVGQPERTIAGSVENGEFRGIIRDGDGERMFIEPVWGRSQAADIDHHVMYTEDDVVPSGGVCVSLGEQVVHQHAGGLRGGPRGGGTITECAKTVCVVEMAVDADNDYLLAWGTEEAVVQQIERVINTVNLQYEADVSIRHALQTILIRMEPFYRVTDSSRLLFTLRSKWRANHDDIDRDIVHMFTGKEIDENVIGIAWLGAICSRDIGYGLSQSDCCGTFAAATDLTAHELGHNWNADHCNCVGWTMNPFITVANRFNPDFTIQDIRRFRTGLSCLSAGSPRPTELPFYDDFEDGFIDYGLWSTVRGAQVNTSGLNEPSGDYSANLDGVEQIATASLDTSISMNLRVEYWWQREGLADGPEAGDDMFVEYMGPNGRNDWVLLREHLGDGPDVQGFTREVFDLPSDAEHHGFRLRFRTVAQIINEDGQPEINDGFDDWFVDNVRITGDPATPQAFELRSPNDGAIAQEFPLLLRWGASERAEAYVLEVSEQPTFVPISYRITVLGTNVLIEDELDRDKRYYWRVKAVNPRGEYLTETATFVTTLGLPGSFEAIRPLQSEIVRDRVPTLEWSASADADRYDLLISRDPDFEDVVVTHFQFAEPGAETETYMVPNTNLENLNGYYWKVSASNIAGERVWDSGTRIFIKAAACLGDVDNDGTVSVNDLSYALLRIGTNDLSGDANRDGVVDAHDISYVLFRIGACR